MDKISIILPVYNCERFLKHTIESVKRQTFQNWELIIADDGSTDNSFSEAYRFSLEDSRIKLLHIPTNQGVSFARNLATQKATGRYIAFIDSDDLWANNKLQKQLEFMQKKHIALSHTAYAYMDEQGKTAESGRIHIDPVVDLKKYMKTTQINISSVMIDRKYISDFNFPEDKQLCEDARLWMHFMRNGWKFYGIDDVLTLYRIRPGQLSRNKIRMAQNTLKRYWNEKRFPEYKRLYYFLNYACNGIKKRLYSQKLDQKDIYDRFNCLQNIK